MSTHLNEICFNNLIDYWKIMAFSETTSIIETVDYIKMNTGIESHLFNPLFLKQKAENLPGNCSTNSFWYNDDWNQNFNVDALYSLELIMEKVPMMSVQLNQEFKPELPPHTTIEMLENSTTDLKEWIRPLQIAFEMDEKTALRYRNALEHSPDKFIHFNVQKNREIVGVASLFLQNEIAGFYNLAVLPEYQNQGLGRALHYVRLNEARRRGYQLATLQATPMASALARKVGFIAHSEFAVYKL